jgi:predicted ATPase
VAESIRQRVAVLLPGAQEVLSAAAIIGRSLPGWLLQQVAGGLRLSQQELIAAVEHLHQARLLVEVDEGGYQFPHDLIREVVEDNLSWARRTHLHWQIAEAVEQGPVVVPIGQIAYHYGRAGNWEKAGMYLERAGDHALALHASRTAHPHNLVHSALRTFWSSGP